MANHDRSVAAGVAAAALATALALSGCAGPKTPSADPPATGNDDGTVPAPPGAGPDPVAAPGEATARTPPSGFGETAIAVTTPSGATVEGCVLVAESAAARGQGLMEVTDPRLGGYDGMLFRFEAPTTATFYMLRTRIALTIAFFADAAFVSATDMVPCPDDDDQPPCPRYSAAAAYTDALEVPAGTLPRLGIAPGARLALGGACPAG